MTDDRFAGRMTGDKQVWGGKMNEDELRVLLVDDDQGLRESLARYLKKHHSYFVDSVSSGEEALSLLETAGGHYNVALLDLNLNEFSEKGLEVTGLDILKEIKAHYPEVEVILFTAYGMGSALEALQAGAYRYFAKPFDKEELAFTIRAAAEQRQARRERQMLAALNRVSAAINATFDLDEIRRLICQVAVEFLGVDHSSLIEFETDYSSGMVRAEYPALSPLNSTKSTVGTKIPVRDIPAEERLIYEKVVLNIPDVDSEFSLGSMRDVLSGFGIRSILIIPILSRGRVVGSFSLDAIKQPRIFSQNEIEFCQSLASQVGIAIENAQLFERLRILSTVGQVLTSGLDLDKVLTQIVNNAVLSLPTAERGAIHLYNEQMGILLLLAHTHHLGPAAINSLTLKPGEGIAGWVYEHQQGVVIFDAWTDSRYKRTGNSEEPIHKSMICVPLHIKNRVIGTLSITNVHATGIFQDDDLKLLSAFADQAAIAIENARLLQEAQEGRDYLGALYEASNRIISPGNPEEVLQEIVDNARISTRAYQVAALLFDETGKPWKLVRSGGEKRKDILEDVRPQGNAVHVLLSGNPLFIAHPADPGLPFPFNPGMVIAGTQAAACLPLSLMGRNIGVLWVEFDAPHTFSEGERKALQLFANQSAIAYDNARRIAELARANEELKELDRKKTEFLSTVSHELRNPLALVQGYIQNLLDGVYGHLTDEQQAKLEIALSGSRQETLIINNLLDLAHIQEGKTRLDLVSGSVTAVISDVINIMQYDAEKKRITLIRNIPDEDPLNMLMDVIKVKQVVTNLIDNALKFTPSGGTVTVAAVDLDDQIEVCIEDTGIGISKDKFEQIFDRFYQVDSSLSRKFSGSGIGLSVSKEFVELHKGRIWLESEVGKGTAFFILLPKRAIEEE